jgi:hypothetical protein
VIVFACRLATKMDTESLHFSFYKLNIFVLYGMLVECWNVIPISFRYSLQARISGIHALHKPLLTK